MTSPGFSLPSEIIDAARKQRENTALSTITDELDRLTKEGMRGLETIAGAAIEPIKPFAAAINGGLTVPSLDDLTPDWIKQATQQATQAATSLASGITVPSLDDLTPASMRPKPAASMAGPQTSPASGVPVTMPTSTADTPLGEIDNSSRQAFVKTAYPHMLQAAGGNKDAAEMMLAAAISENGSVGTGKPFWANNFFGIKGTGPAGSAKADTWEQEGGQRVNQQAQFAAYNTPTEGFRGFFDFLERNPRYAPAMAAYRQTGDAGRLFRDVNAAGYATDPSWADKVASIRATQVSPVTATLTSSAPPVLTAPSRQPALTSGPVPTAAPGGLDVQGIMKTYEGKPYVFGGAGGRSDFTPGAATDCSGFVSAVYKNQYGISLPAHTDAAYNALKQQGSPEISQQDARPGDVVFYMGAGTGGTISHHMGIYAGPGRVLDMSVSGGSGVKERPIGHAGQFVILRDSRVNAEQPRTAQAPPPIVPSADSGGVRVTPAQADALASSAAPNAGGPAIPAAAPPPAPAGVGPPAGDPVRDDWRQDISPNPLDDARASTGGGPLSMRQPLDAGVPVRDRWADELQVPYDPDQGPREATPGSVGATPIISPMAPPENPGVSTTAAAPAPPQIQISQGGPPTPAAQWTPVDTRPTPQPAPASAFKPLYDAAGRIVGYVQDAAEGIKQATTSVAETVKPAGGVLGIDPDRPRRIVEEAADRLGMRWEPRTRPPLTPPESTVVPNLPYSTALANARDRGFSNAGASIIDAAAETSRMLGLPSAADAFEEWADQIISSQPASVQRRRTKDALESPFGLAEAAVESLPSVAPTVLGALLAAGGVLTGNPGVAAAGTGVARAGLAAGGLSSFGSQARDLRPDIAAGRISQGMANAVAIGSGLVEVATEKMFPGIDSKLVKGMGAEVAEKMLADLRKKGLIGAGKNILRETGQEGIEEMVAESYGVAVDSVWKEKGPTLAEAARRIGAAGAVGSVMGGGIATGMQAVEAVGDRQARGRVAEDVQGAGRAVAEEAVRRGAVMPRAIGDETGGTPLPGMPERTRAQPAAPDRYEALDAVRVMYAGAGRHGDQSLDEGALADRAMDLAHRMGALEEVYPLAQAVRNASTPMERQATRDELRAVLDDVASRQPDGTPEEIDRAEQVVERDRRTAALQATNAKVGDRVHDADGKEWTVEKADQGGVIRVQDERGVSKANLTRNFRLATEDTDEDTPTAREYSSTQLDLPETLARRVRNYSKNAIPDADLAENGREDEPHVTVKYGLTTENADDVRRIVEAHGPIPITLGKVSTFDKAGGGKFDVVKVDVDSPQLRALNAELAKLPNEDEHPEYTPHMTLAYVKPGLGRKYRGSQKLDGIKTTIKDVTFSSKTGEKVTIPLLGRKSFARTDRGPATPEEAERDRAEFLAEATPEQPKPRAQEDAAQAPPQAEYRSAAIKSMADSEDNAERVKTANVIEILQSLRDADKGARYSYEKQGANGLVSRVYREDVLGKNHLGPRTPMTVGEIRKRLNASASGPERGTLPTEGEGDDSRGRVPSSEQDRPGGTDRGALADTRQRPVPRAEAERRSGDEGAPESGRDTGGRPEPSGRRSDRARGVGSGDARGRPSRPQVAPAQRLETAPASADVVMTDDDLVSKTPVERWTDNLDALKILMQLRAEKRPATVAEQRTLARYSGFGDSAFEHAFRPDARAPNPAWKRRGDELRALVSKPEYEAIRASRINANYTSAEVIGAMWGALDRMGLKDPGLRVLDPSAGSGRFFGFMPPSMVENASRWMVELDTVTGEIARALFPQSSVQITGFQDARIPADSFDLAISNVPFSKDVRIGRGQDPSIPAKLGNLALHNYFFFKALQAVRPGGVVAFITTHQTLDAPSSTAFRRHIAGQADLLGAIRLPQDAFVDTAVTTDVVFLKKRAPGEVEGKTAWTETEQRTGEDGTAYPLNEYFIDNPGMALGTHSTTEGRGLYTGKEYRLIKDGGDLADALRAAVGALPVDAFTPMTPDSFNADLDEVQAAHDVKPGAYVVQPGKLGTRVLKVHSPVTQTLVTPAGMSDAAQARVIRMMDVRDAARAVLARQLDPQASDASVKQAQATLARAYNGFVREYGPISEGYNQSLMRTEPDAPLLRALERRETLAELRKRRTSEGRRITSGAQAGKIEPKPWPKLITDKDLAALKMPIFTERVITPVKKIDTADTPSDALSIVLNERGAIDAKRMSELLGGRAEAEILDDLISEGVVYHDPDGGHKLAEEYLSGDVVTKLARAEEAAATDGAFDRNVTALKAVQPQPLKASEVSIRLGAPWVPEQDVNDFVQQLLEGKQPPGYRYIPALGQWTREDRYYGYNVQRSLNNGTYGTNDIDAVSIIDRMLSGRDVTLRRPVPGERDRTEVDPEATQKAQAKVRDIRAAWTRWLRGDANRMARLVDLYNDKFNREVPRGYDGKHLTFPGMAQAKPPREHQRNAVWRVIQNGTVLMAHEVGAGKTIAMAGSAMELRRLGLSRKNLFVVPNHLVGQFAQEFLSAYPSANVLVPRPVDFQAKNRQELMARIATGDYDAIVVAQSQFTLLPISEQRQAAMMGEEMAQLEAAIREEQSGRGYSGKSQSEKELEKAKKRLESRLKDMQGKISARQDDMLTFEQLGIDALFVDEADMYKNLSFVTRKTRVKGLPNAKSQRAFDMHAKTRIIREGHGGRGVVFATGTPVSNTIAELWTMLRYLAPERLDQNGLGMFDSWADTFGDTITQGEMTTTGKFEMVTRFAQFQNAAELNKLFQSVADIVTEDDMPELATLKPKLRGGERKDVVVPRTDALVSYMKEIEARAKNLKNVDPTEDNMLKISSDARKAALDIRLANPRAPEDPNGKIDKAADQIAAVWEREGKKRGTQLVFLDMGTPKALSDEEIAKLEKAESDSLRAAATATEDAESVAEEEEVEIGGLTAEEQRVVSDVYSRIKAKLVARGIPAAQVAFIHDAKTKAQKQKLFDDVNDGTIRVLLGSTEKLGAGTNVQQRLAALHHLDAPWRPRDVEQREGRILRQGNKVYGPDGDNSGIEIYRYLTEGSFDSVMWSGILAKAKAIKSMVRRVVTARTIEDADEFVLSAAQAAALATGNPDIVRYTEMKAELGELEGGFAAHQDAAVEYERIIRTTPGEIAELENDIADLTKARTEIEREAAKGFAITINGQRYTKREAATFDALLEAVSRGYGQKEWTPVATLYGSDLQARMTWGNRIERRLVRPDGTQLGSWTDNFNDINGRGQLQAAERASSSDHLKERTKYQRTVITRKRTSMESAERQRAQAGPFDDLRRLERLRADVPRIEARVTNPPPERSGFPTDEAYQEAEAEWRKPFTGISDDALDRVMDEKYGAPGSETPAATPPTAAVEVEDEDVPDIVRPTSEERAEVARQDAEIATRLPTGAYLTEDEDEEAEAPSEPTLNRTGYVWPGPNQITPATIRQEAQQAAPTPEPPTQQQQIVSAIDNLKAAILGEPEPAAPRTPRATPERTPSAPRPAPAPTPTPEPVAEEEPFEPLTSVAEPTEAVRAEQTEVRLPVMEAMYDGVTPEVIDEFLPEDAPEGQALAIYEQMVDDGKVSENGQVVSGEVIEPEAEAPPPTPPPGPSAGPTVITGSVVSGSSRPTGQRRARQSPPGAGTTPPTPPPPTNTDNPGAERPEDSGDPANEALGKQYGRPIKDSKRLTPNAIEAIRRAYVRAMTDDRVDLNMLVEEIEREHGPLPPELQVDMLVRMSPGMAAKVTIDQGLKPHLRGLSESDLAWLDVYLTHMDNLDVARAMGLKAEKETIEGAAPFRGRSWQQLQAERARLRAFELGGIAPHPQKAATSAKRVQQLERQVQRDEVRHQQTVMRRAARRRGRVESERLFSEGLTVADSHRALGAMARELGARRLAKLQKAATGVWEFNRSLLASKLENDVISQELYDELVSRYPHYVPTRIVDYMGDHDNDGPAVGKSLSMNDPGLRRNTLEGTRRRRENPLASTYRNAIETERIVKQNQVALGMKQLIEADPDGLGEEFREAPEGYTLRTGEGYLTGYEGGKKFRYVTGKPMSDALKTVAASPVHRFFTGFMHFWKELITRFPLFIAYQVPQDAMSYGLREFSRGGGNPLTLPNIIADLVVGYGIAFRGLLSGEYKGSAADYLKSGGGMAGFNMRDVDTAREKVYELNGKPNLMRLIRAGVLFEWSQAIGERIEMAPRVASYRRAKRLGLSEVESTVAGRDVTLDFLRGGYFARYLNGLLGFFNVGAQASASIPRMWHENPRGFVLMASMMIGGAAILEATMSGDDDDEWDDLPKYLKDRGLLFPTGGTSTTQEGEKRPRYVMLPVRELAPLLIVAREAVRRFQGKTGRDGLELLGAAMMAASPIQANSASDLFGGFFPELIATPAQLAMDYDWFRGGRIKGQRSDEQASNLATWVAHAAQFIGDRNEALRGLGNVTPSQVEFAARGVGGHFARTVGAASDIGKDRGQQDRGPIDTPLVGGLVGRFLTDAGGERLREAQEERNLIALDVRKTLRDAKVNVTVGTVRGTIENIPLHRDEQARYQELANQFTDRELRALLRSGEFKTTRGAAKAKLVQEAITRARETARERVMDRIPVSEQERRKRAEEKKAS